MTIPDEELRKDLCSFMLEKAGVEVLRYLLRVLLLQSRKSLAQGFFESLLRRV